MLKAPYPYYLSSAEQCRRMDSRTINEFGIDGFTLMEVAGTKAADFILSETSVDSLALFFCGKGNNAGDALVIARILSEKGYSITICFVDGTESLSEDTEKNFQLLKKLSGDIRFIEWNTDLRFSEFDFIVDGMFGTGLNSDVRAPYKEVIQSVNKSNLSIFSLDLPSGLHADTGQIMGTAIKADFTLTFGALKTGFYLNDGFDLTGDIILCELPFPNHFKEKSAVLIDEDWALKSDSKPTQRAHKYDGGVLYIIAGSEGLTGAAILASKSAWATGIGAVILITPKGLLRIYEEQLIQIIKKPIGTHEDVFFSENHLEEVNSILKEKPGTLLIGPGIGRNPSITKFVQQLLSGFEGNVVIDADALFAISTDAKFSKPASSIWVLTPHPGELKALLNINISDDYDRLKQIEQYAKEKKITILSKGFPGIIGTTSGDVYLTGYDTRIFSRAGFGDVLAGKLSAFLLKTNNPELACINALLDGKQKAFSFLDLKESQLEPIDLI